MTFRITLGTGLTLGYSNTVSVSTVTACLTRRVQIGRQLVALRVVRLFHFHLFLPGLSLLQLPTSVSFEHHLPLSAHLGSVDHGGDDCDVILDTDGLARRRHHRPGRRRRHPPHILDQVRHHAVLVHLPHHALWNAVRLVLFLHPWNQCLRRPRYLLRSRNAVLNIANFNHHGPLPLG